MAKGGRNGVDMLTQEPIVDESLPTLLLLGYVRGMVSWPGCQGAVKGTFWG